MLEYFRFGVGISFPRIAFSATNEVDYPEGLDGPKTEPDVADFRTHVRGEGLLNVSQGAPIWLTGSLTIEVSLTFLWGRYFERDQQEATLTRLGELGGGEYPYLALYSPGERSANVEQIALYASEKGHHLAISGRAFQHSDNRCIVREFDVELREGCAA